MAKLFGKSVEKESDAFEYMEDVVVSRKRVSDTKDEKPKKKVTKKATVSDEDSIPVKKKAITKAKLKTVVVSDDDVVVVSKVVKKTKKLSDTPFGSSASDDDANISMEDVIEEVQPVKKVIKKKELEMDEDVVSKKVKKKALEMDKDVVPKKKAVVKKAVVKKKAIVESDEDIEIVEKKPRARTVVKYSVDNSAESESESAEESFVGDSDSD